MVEWSDHSLKPVCLLTPQIGGVATNFRLPDVVNVGLGGGSVVTVQEASGAGMVSDLCERKCRVVVVCGWIKVCYVRNLQLRT